LRLLPLIKLPFDVTLYLLNWKELFPNLNPLSCVYRMQRWMGYQGSVELPQFWSQALLVGLLTISALCVSYRLIQMGHAQWQLWQLRRSATRCRRAIGNPALSRALQSVSIWEADVASPCATVGGHILLPARLVQRLSQAEFEAVIAHELEHLRWHDPLFKQLTVLIRAAFWWVPTGWWMRKLYQDQERACDGCISRYEIAPTALASAIGQTLLQAKAQPTLFSCHFAAERGEGLERVQAILARCPSPSRWNHLAGVGVSSLTAVCIWIC
jgi:beta-lactamase regulating signal transducer with metallopeptidase domain